MCDVPVQETHTTILKWGLVQWNRDEWFELLDVRQSCWETKRQEAPGDDDLLSQLSHANSYEG